MKLKLFAFLLFILFSAIFLPQERMALALTEEEWMEENCKCGLVCNTTWGGPLENVRICRCNTCGGKAGAKINKGQQTSVVENPSDQMPDSPSSPIHSEFGVEDPGDQMQ